MRTRVEEALAGVVDPELGVPLMELGMVDEITERRGRVRVRLLLTTESCPMTDTIRADVTRALGTVDGVRDVEVHFGSMSARARAEVMEHLPTAPLQGGLGSRLRVYLVASGKGGVGKSTVTANLAASVAAGGSRVGVLDADVWGFSMPHLFGVHRAPVVLGGKMIPVPAHGVSLMSMGFFVNETQPVVWRGPMLQKALEQFVADTHWGQLDALFVDLPPGTGDVALSLPELLPDACLLVVTTPQPAAHVVACRVARMATDTGLPIAGVVENMTAAVCDGCGSTTALFGEGGGAALAAQCGAPLLGQIPLDIAAREAGDSGVPVVLADPTAASARELRRIAGILPTPRRPLAGRSLPLSVVGGAG